MAGTLTYGVSSTASSLADFSISAGSPSPFSSSSWVPLVINLEETNARQLYTRLVTKFSWNPMRSLQLIAVWIWFDQNCCRGRLVNRRLDSSDLIISILADEASVYLACLSIKYYPIEFDHH
ncbi:hypothetical protein SAY86_025463 [Trapa natans]|uniref:Uncharacterized protein n=1 Tax=Trapa natans TaxID=22666 RepID=A0AAN7M0Q6_TRANT|nr:hypothetical protein SAY86_025463 [Trapa natans]